MVVTYQTLQRYSAEIESPNLMWSKTLFEREWLIFSFFFFGFSFTCGLFSFCQDCDGINSLLAGVSTPTGNTSLQQPTWTAWEELETIQKLFKKKKKLVHVKRNCLNVNKLALYFFFSEWLDYNLIISNEFSHCRFHQDNSYYISSVTNVALPCL